MAGSVIRLGTGLDHASLALLPFGVAHDERRFEPMTVAYQTNVDGKLRRINITLDPGSEVGLPLPGDQVVFLALLQLAMRAEEPGPRLTFAPIDVIRELGWTKCGRNYDRLREALERLVRVTITVNSAMVSRRGTEYKRSSHAAHILESYQLYDANDRSWVEWGFLVREAMRLGDFKRLDWGLAKTLSNPTAVQLYRLLDRVVLSGERQWEIGCRPLAEALGLSSTFDRPATFHRIIRPHIESLIRHEVIESYTYQRGGHFTFVLYNYLRAELRRSLVQLGVYPELARQLVAGYDEVGIMCQLDAVRWRDTNSPAGFVSDAIRKEYPLRYPDDEPEQFLALWELVLGPERQALHAAVLRLLGENLFTREPDPLSWPVEARGVVRFMLTYNLDPERV